MIKSKIYNSPPQKKNIMGAEGQKNGWMSNKILEVFLWIKLGGGGLGEESSSFM